jgi:hypothetical protein
MANKLTSRTPDYSSHRHCEGENVRSNQPWPSLLEEHTISFPVIHLTGIPFTGRLHRDYRNRNTNQNENGNAAPPTSLNTLVGFEVGRMSASEIWTLGFELKGVISKG